MLDQFIILTPKLVGGTWLRDGVDFFFFYSASARGSVMEKVSQFKLHWICATHKNNNNNDDHNALHGHLFEGIKGQRVGFKGIKPPL